MSDSKYCFWNHGQYYERECEHCKQAVVDEQANAHHDGRRPLLYSRDLRHSTLTKAHRLTLEGLMAQPEFRALVEPMTSYLDKHYGQPEEE